MSEYSLTIDRVYNNSLGNTWLFKLYDEDSGELLEKCSYDSEYSSTDALYAFEADYVLSYVDSLADISFFTVMPEAENDALREAISFVERYGSYPDYGVEFRDMSSAIHHLLVFESENDAEDAFASLTAAEESGDDAEADWAFHKAKDDIEINFRDVDFDEDVNNWYWKSPYDGSRIIVVNTAHIVPDVF